MKFPQMTKNTRRTLSYKLPAMLLLGCLICSPAYSSTNEEEVKIDTLEADVVNDALNDSERKLRANMDELGYKSSSGVASAASLQYAPFVAGKFTYAVGLGYFDGESALGVSVRKTADNGRWSVFGGVSTNTQNEPLIQVGVAGIVD